MHKTISNYSDVPCTSLIYTYIYLVDHGAISFWMALCSGLYISSCHPVSRFRTVCFTLLIASFDVSVVFFVGNLS